MQPALMLNHVIVTFLMAGVGASAQTTLTVTTAEVESTRSLQKAVAPAAPTGILKYEPSRGGNYTVGCAYTLLCAVTVWHVLRRKDHWALCLPIGCLCSALGFFVRPSIDPYNVSLGLYIVQSMFVVISPAAFLAFNYLLYGRMILSVDRKFGGSVMESHELERQALTTGQKLTMMHKARGRKTEKSRFSFIPPRIVGRVFVWSDVITFLVQCSAGGLQASGGSGNTAMVNVGDKLFLAGVIIQGLSYILFTLLLTYATCLVIRDGSRAKADFTRPDTILGVDKHVLALVGGLYLSSIFIIVGSAPDDAFAFVSVDDRVLG
ncbi:hypothetical protein PHSY_000088 [Pseudozyma hubeiensis SY62]|uniref:Uncharacterized protein n=1 Tax=Pseudozyma hubeiensis (strain SY62) TaxID=1305764 RepID=R9NVN7_PSEHS|nr:hypothetical protein PHSY_000088 [Pseudozyma hubeiensis SY62]GAC92534.1 hypothetical protein PHSY_000088 [Pseudozyma hubeiensis SY62]